MRVVLDTNVLVSMVLVRGGRFHVLWRAWRDGRFDVLSCRELDDEVRAVLGRPKLAGIVDAELRENLLRDLASLTVPVQLVVPWPEFRDPKDRFLLALARDGRASVLVTGDSALVDLAEAFATVIASPTDFMRALEKG